jgi:hypothetical protein
MNWNSETLDALARQVGMTSLLFNGAASCVHSDGCHGVTEADLRAFAEAVSQHTMREMLDGSV